jgi:rubrerythrin
MEKTEFVDRLNADLGTEFQSIVQYVQHVATIKGAEYRSIAEELGNHLAQELEHAKILAPRSTSSAAPQRSRYRRCTIAPTRRPPCKQTWNSKNGSCSGTGTG